MAAIMDFGIFIGEDCSVRQVERWKNKIVKDVDVDDYGTLYIKQRSAEKKIIILTECFFVLKFSKTLYN